MRHVALASLFILAMALGGRTAVPVQNAGQTGQAAPATQGPYEALLYENADMRIFDVAVPPHASTLLHQHDSIFVAIENSTVTLQAPGQAAVQLKLAAGAVRFVRGGLSQTLTNDGDQPFRDVTIEFLNPKLTGGGCSCSGASTDSICGCPSAATLPANWELGIGRVRLTGMTLAPGATYEVADNRNTRFLVAVTPFDMMDVSIHEPRNVVVRLPEGRFHWLAPGPHKIQNLSSQPMRFVSVEFYGTPENSDQG